VFFAIFFHPLPAEARGKLQLTGQNLDRVFNSRSGCMCALHLCSNEAKRPHLKLETRLKHLLGSLSLAFVLPAAPVEQ